VTAIGHPMTEAQWRALQNEFNDWTDKYLSHVPHLIVDGKPGKLTRSRIMRIKWYLGYSLHRNPWLTREFLNRMRNPHTAGYFPKGMLGTGKARRREQRRAFVSERFKATVAPGVTTFDGRPCAVWLAKILQRVRDEGNWKGGLNSGWRSPAYSTSLCYQRCGAPSCSGTCAGASSNHSGTYYPRGAVDVSDYYTFGAECRRLGIGIHNGLGAQDPVHFSVAGN